MDRVQASDLINVFFSEYLRLYRIDLRADSIFLWMEREPGDAEGVGEFREPGGEPESFSAFVRAYARENVIPEYWEWFSFILSAEQIYDALRVKSFFSISAPLTKGVWTRLDIRCMKRQNGLPVSVLLGVPPVRTGEAEYLQEDQESGFVERYMHSVSMDDTERANYKTAMNIDAISTYEINVTTWQVLRENVKDSRVYYHVDGKEIPGPMSDFTGTWAARILSGNADAFLRLVDRENLLRLYEKGERQPWIEYMVHDLLGRTVWIRQSFMLRKDNDTGDILGLIILHDITERRSMELENERRLTVIEGLSREYTSVFVVDLENDTYLAYRLIEEIRTKYAACFRRSFTESLKELTAKSVYGPDQQQFLVTLSPEGLRTVLKDEDEYSFTFRGRLTDPVYYRCMVANISRDRKKIKFVLIGIANINEERLSDLQAQILLESALTQAKQAGEAKTAFLSNMSHDIRTPMNAILGFASLAKLHLDDPELVRDCLSKILTSGNHLQLLINNVLDMTRIESGRLSLEEEPCSLRDMLDEVRDFVQQEMHSKRIVFEENIADDVPDRVLTDRLKFTQLLLNLVSNAVKYSNEEGRISVSVADAGAEPGGYRRLSITVRDDGIGMSPEFVEHIFEPFAREDRPDVRRITGSGLGMSIVHGIAEMMGGSVSIKSEIGKGSEFTVLLTLKIQNPDGETAPPEEVISTCRVFEENTEKGERRAGVRYRILLVEDNHINQDIAAHFLQYLGYDYEVAENGKEAIERITGAEPGYFSAVLMDIRMPVMNGYEAAEKIRTLPGAYRRIPVIAMTADAFEDDMSRAKQAGMNAFIAKPVDMLALKQILERFV